MMLLINKIYFYILFMLMFFCCFARGEEILVKKVKVKCQLAEFCKDYKLRYENILMGRNSKEDIKKAMRVSLLEGDIEKLKYEILKIKKYYVVKIYLKQKNKINSISFYPKSLIKHRVSVLKIIPLKEGAFFSKRGLKKSVKLINKIFTEKGYRKNKIIPIIKFSKNSVSIKFKILLGEEVIISKINLDAAEIEKEFLKEDFKRWKGVRWDSVNFKNFLENLSKKYFSKGFYNFYVTIKKVYYSFDGREVRLILAISLGEKKTFYFKGNRFLDRNDILARIKKRIVVSKKRFGTKDLRKIIKNLYEEKGIYNSGIKVNLSAGRTKEELRVKSYFCYIKVGKKVTLSKIKFEGANLVGKDKILKLFFNKSSPLTKNNYLDKNYLNSFKTILEEEYYKQGFLFVEISDPLISFGGDEKKASVVYSIKEGSQILLKDIILKNIPRALRLKILSSIKNKIGNPLNVVEIKDDLNFILNLVKEDGYYFAKIKNLDLKSLVQYTSDYKSAIIYIDFELEKKSVFESFLITGNRKTKREVIVREVKFKKGEMITPRKMAALRERLSSLGLFSAITLTPYKVEKSSEEKFYYVDLVVGVKERNSIQLTLAPGYRTDIGVKLSTELKFSNFQGMNRSLIVKAQTNQRLDFSNLDERRLKEEKRLLEYSLKTSFFEPYFLDTRLAFEGTAVASRKRQRGFDADFLKTSMQITRNLSSKLSYSLRYQLEAINQFDATLDKDKGFVRIGAITPSLTYDFRENKINPQRGGVIGLSAEFASPTFFSMKAEGKEVNYVKLISRNRYYFNAMGWVYACSLSFGYQKNLATDVLVDSYGMPVVDTDGSYKFKGFIPSIKVFSLSGIDNVRGFTPNEINKLDTGENIGEVVVKDKAFFSNLKFEPRYYFSDQFAFSLFVDGGRLYVGEFNPLTMRFGAGVGVKLLTPVGSLDFDYGVKLKRKVFSSSQKEEFGRFHLSIGFF